MAAGPHAIVTGGAGFIGSHLVERLLADHHRVTVLDDLSTGTTDNLKAVARDPKLTFIQGKVSECPGIGRMVASADCIFHLAAAVGVELVLQKTTTTIQTNVRESEVILLHAARDRIPILIASSSEVYGKSQKEAFSEDDDLIIGPPTIARWSYACSKLMTEFFALALVRSHSLPVVIARIFNTVGPRQTGRYGMVLPRFIEAARSGTPLQVFGDGQQSRCFCWIHDAVESLIRLAQTQEARGTVVNVGSDQPITILELAAMVRDELSSTSRIESVPYARAYPDGFEDLRHRRPNLAKLVRLTGFQPSTPLPEILRLMP